MTRKPSVFYTEKRVLTMFPYWLVVSVLVMLTLLSYLPYKVSNEMLQSSLSRKIIKALMRHKGPST